MSTLETFILFLAVTSFQHSQATLKTDLDRAWNQNIQYECICITLTLFGSVLSMYINPFIGIDIIILIWVNQ